MKAARKDFFSRQNDALLAGHVLFVLFVLTTILLAGLAGLVIEFSHVKKFHDDGFGSDSNGFETSHIIFFASIILMILVSGSLVMIYKIKNQGIHQLLSLAGAREILANSATPSELRFLNVIEEMSVASGLPVPHAFVLTAEPSINAFTAGLTPSTACICATDGALKYLSRTELQGVVAHEFSHILHGDMLYNTKMIGVLNGYRMFTKLGCALCRIARKPDRRGRESSDGANIWYLGFALRCFGSFGEFVSSLLRAAFNRQREWLADASAVQFARDQEGIRGALIKIDRNYHKGIEDKMVSGEYSNMFLVNALGGFWSTAFDSHPPIQDRIRQLGQPDYESPQKEQLIDYEALEDAFPLLNDISDREFAAQNCEFPTNGSNSILLQSISGPSQSQLKSARAEVSQSSLFSNPGDLGDFALVNAQKLISRIPDKLLRDIRDAHKAFAIVTGIVIFRGSEDPVKKLSVYRELEMRSSTFFDYILNDVFPLLKDLDDSQFFIIGHLSGKTLRQQDSKDLLHELEFLCHIIEFDGRITAIELSLVLGFAGSIADEKSLRESIYQGQQDEFSDISRLVAFVASLASSGSDLVAERGYQIAASMLGLTNVFPTHEIIDTAALLRAIGHVKAFSFTKRLRFVQALLKCIRSDNHVNESEYLALRSICTVLDCPFPLA